MHQLVVREVARLRRVGEHRRPDGVEVLHVLRGTNALEEALVARFQSPTGGERLNIVQLERRSARVSPHGARLLKRRRRRRARWPERLVEDIRGPALEVLVESELARELVPLCREVVLVVQRGLGAALVIDVAGVPVGEIGKSQRRIERVVHDAVRLPLAALAVQAVGGELVVVARLIASRCR